MNTYGFNQEQLEQMTKTATKQAEEIAALGRTGFDAWMKTANILMDGTQSFVKTCTDMANQACETQETATKKFMSCKTLNEMTETSTKVAQDITEQTMSNATALSEKAIKVCMDTMEPLNDTMNQGIKATKKATKAA